MDDDMVYVTGAVAGCDLAVLTMADSMMDDGCLVVESTPSNPKELDFNDYFAKLKLNDKKSPVSIVDELMSCHGEKVHYTLISTRGELHCLEFTYRLTYNNISVSGNGSSKKEAKKNTAIAFLKKLGYFNNTETSTDLKTLFSLINNNHELKTANAEPKLNYVGILQELCMSRQWELPKYEFLEKELSDNTWAVICCCQFYKSKGVDKYKKIAKNKSAYLIYEQIKGLSQEEVTFLNSHVKL